jgi:hypothetical protein
MKKDSFNITVEEQIKFKLRASIIPMDVEKIARNIITIKGLSKFRVSISFYA